MKIQVSLSRGKKGKGKKKGPRSQFFSALMTELAGDTGDHVSETYVNKNKEAFLKAMKKVIKGILSRMDDIEKGE